MFAAEERKRRCVVLYPSPGMGHLVSMVELGKLFVLHGIAVTVVTVDAPYNTGSTAAFIARASAANPSITFHRLPPVTLPPNPSPHQEALAFDLLRLSNANLLAFLRDVAPRAIVVDMFCRFAFDAAAELCMPCYTFFTSGASVLATLFYVPTLHSATVKSFRLLGSAALLVPGIRHCPPTTCRSQCWTPRTRPTWSSSTSAPACRTPTASSSTRSTRSSRGGSKPLPLAVALRTAGRLIPYTPSDL
ncbi:unnamed protein product [Musa textilis]